MIRRLFKYVLFLFLVVFLFFSISATVILYTEWGGRLVIDIVKNQTDNALKIESFEGTLADNLVLKKVRFEQDNLQVHVDELEYKVASIDWFGFSVSMDKIAIQNLEVWLQDSSTDASSNEPFNGIESPISILIEGLYVDKVSIHQGDSIHQVKDLSVALALFSDQLTIEPSYLTYENIGLKIRGQLQLKKNLPFKLFPLWEMTQNGIQLTGSGQVKGDLNKVLINQDLSIKQEDLTAISRLDAELDLSGVDPRFNVRLVSEEFHIKALDQTGYEKATINDLNISVDGNINDYRVNSSWLIKTEALAQTHLKVIGQGDITQIKLTELSIDNEATEIDGIAAINWDKGVVINADINIASVDVGYYLTDWPGNIQGKLSFGGTMNDGDYHLDVNKMTLTGALKDQSFELQSVATINNDQLSINQGQLNFGENKITVNGSYSSEVIKGQLDVDAKDLGFFHKDMHGSIDAQVSISGDINNLKTIGSIQGSSIRMNDYEVEKIVVDIDGGLRDGIDLTSQWQSVKFFDLIIKEVDISLKGDAALHNANIEVLEQDHRISFKYQGKADLDKYTFAGMVKQLQWSDNILNTQWDLNQDVSIDFDQNVTISQACWSEQNIEGDICAQLESEQGFSSIIANVNFERLDMILINDLFPDDIDLKGTLNGDVLVNYQETGLSITSDISLVDGQLMYTEHDDTTFSAVITEAKIIANTENDRTELSSIISLDDGSHLNIDGNLNNNADKKLMVQARVDGQFNNTRYLSALTTEIDEVNGNFTINGTIAGEVNDPNVVITAKQEDGYIVINRTGVKVMNLSLSLQKDNDKAPENKQLVINVNGTTTNGDIALEAWVGNDSNNNQKILIGTIKGQVFRLLTLPEIELDISPDLSFRLGKEKLQITGVVDIPFGVIKIVELPESAATTSTDAVVHTSVEKEQAEDAFVVNYDVNARLIGPISVEALGLETELTGNIRVNNNKDQYISANGELNLKNGQYTIYGQTLKVVKGRLIFNGDVTNPNLDIIANRTSIDEDVVAGIEIGGTVNQLQSSLYSEPSLSDLQILAYIMTGRGLNEGGGSDSTQLAQAAIILGLKKSSPVFSQIQSAFGIDVLNVKEGATSADSVVEAGKQLNKDTYIGYNHGLFNRQGFWVLRYQINKALRLETTQGEYQSVDLIYIRKKK